MKDKNDKDTAAYGQGEIKTARVVDRIGQFTTVPNSFIKAKGISHEAFRLFVMLRFHTYRDTEAAFPSYDTLQCETGIRSRATISKSLKQLEKAGWIERKKRFSKSTLYTLTLPLSGEGTDAAVSSSSFGELVHEMNHSSSPDELPVVHQMNPNQTKLTRPNNQTKKNLSAKPEPTPRERDLFFDKLTQITGSDPILNGSLLGKTKSQLIKANATLDQLDMFCSYWYAADWRGQKGQLPTLTQITSEWGKAKTWEGNSQSAGASTNNGEWEWATIPTGIVLRHKGGTFPSLRGEEAKLKAREVGLEVIF